MNVTRIHTGSDGLTRFSALDVALASRGAIGLLSAEQPARGLIFRQTDETYDYDWHCAPQKQWLVLLDGEIEIETGDGDKRRFRGGDVLLLEDIEGRGHRTRQISTGARRSLFIPFPPA